MLRRHSRDQDRCRKFRALIEQQIAMLVRYECIDGGWCYYDDFSYPTARPSGSTISFVTATVLVVLDDARKAGIKVPQKIVDRGMASLLRQRKRDFSYDYGEYLKYHPMMPINRPGGSLGRSQACNLAMRAWGDKRVTDTVVETWLDRLFARELWLDLGRKRPIPHESWFQVAGYFFYYGHYYAGRCIEILPPAERPPRQDQLAQVLLRLQEPDGAVRHGLCADEPGAMQTQVSGNCTFRRAAGEGRLISKASHRCEMGRPVALPCCKGCRQGPQTARSHSALPPGPRRLEH
jgi:hypothetical protein